MPRKRRRYRILLDEGVPIPIYFLLLNRLHDVKHVVSDFQMEGASDAQVYLHAVKEKRLVVTFNKKHFNELAGNSKDSGIIAITHELSPKHRDRKLAAFLRRKTPGELFGCFNVITGETDTKILGKKSSQTAKKL